MIWFPLQGSLSSCPLAKSRPGFNSSSEPQRFLTGRCLPEHCLPGAFLDWFPTHLLRLPAVTESIETSPWRDNAVGSLLGRLGLTFAWFFTTNLKVFAERPTAVAPQPLPVPDRDPQQSAITRSNRLVMTLD